MKNTLIVRKNVANTDDLFTIIAEIAFKFFFFFYEDVSFGSGSSRFHPINCMFFSLSNAQKSSRSSLLPASDALIFHIRPVSEHIAPNVAPELK